MQLKAFNRSKTAARPLDFLSHKHKSPVLNPCCLLIVEPVDNLVKHVLRYNKLKQFAGYACKRDWAVDVSTPFTPTFKDFFATC